MTRFLALMIMLLFATVATAALPDNMRALAGLKSAGVMLLSLWIESEEWVALEIVPEYGLHSLKPLTF